MKMNKMIAAITLCSVAGGAVAQTKMSVEEKRGLLGGAAVGAVAGGPIGAGFGAIVGSGVFGKLFTLGRENRELKSALAVSEQESQAERTAFEAESRLLNQDLDTLMTLQAIGPRKQQTQIQFRSGSSTIETHYFPQLEKVAGVLLRNPDATITLAGYTDRRGSADANNRLSENRVKSVKAYLLAHGVRKGQVITTAYGESRPVEATETLEGNFFDRRVVMEVSLDLEPRLATR